MSKNKNVNVLAGRVNKAENEMQLYDSSLIKSIWEKFCCVCTERIFRLIWFDVQLFKHQSGINRLPKHMPY